MIDYASEIAKIALQTRAILLRPEDPFTWTSGYRMPIYNDNRLLLSQYSNRKLVAEGFSSLIKQYSISVDVVAGTATAGIPPAVSLADRLELPLVYVRAEVKGHGLQKRIEGFLERGKKVLLIEDLVSTGKSSLSALEALREAGGVVENCFSVFSYGFPEATKLFEKNSCRLIPLLTFSRLIGVARETGYITPEQFEVISSWQENPFSWGEAHGFPKVVKDRVE